MEVISLSTEKSRISVKELIDMGREHIDGNFGGGTSKKILRLFEDYFDAIDEYNRFNSDDNNMKLDTARLNVYSELNRGLSCKANTVLVFINHWFMKRFHCPRFLLPRALA